MAKEFKVNKDLIWDYSFSEDDYKEESFKKWYISRVLSRGSFEDIKNIGLDTIYKYFAELTVPYQVRKFWDWVFSLSSVKKKYEHIDRKPGENSSPGIPSPFVKG